MNREDIIRKMQEAGLKAPARGDFIFIHWDQIAMLLDHERAAEREACAKVCENQPSPLLEPLTMYTGSEAAKVVLNSRKYLAAAIRARSQP